jgi:phosphatidylserine/phosphatidylglycerophosphate/cardiolipin synthase-like enzyme
MLRRIGWIIVAGALSLGGLRLIGNSNKSPFSHPSAEFTSQAISVWFSPNGGCTDAVVGAVDAGKSSILVQAYSFTSAPIAKALKDAHDRGLDVRVILDKSQRTEKYSGLTYLRHAGIPVWIDASHAIAHNKVMVIDGQTIVTGSFNFTKSAEHSNAENLLIIQDSALAKAYAQNWADHLAHSEAQ